MNFCHWNYICVDSKCDYHCEIMNIRQNCSMDQCFENCPDWSSWSSCQGKQLTHRTRNCKCEHPSPNSSKYSQRQKGCLQQRYCSPTTLGTLSTGYIVVGLLLLFTVLISLLMSYFWCKKHKDSSLEEAASMGETSEFDEEVAPIPHSHHRALPTHLIENLPSEYVNTDGLVRATLPSYDDKEMKVITLPPPYTFIPRGSFIPSVNYANEASENCPPSYRTSLGPSYAPTYTINQPMDELPAIPEQERF